MPTASPTPGSTGALAPFAEALVPGLAARRLASGAFADHDGGGASAEATAWTAIAGRGDALGDGAAAALVALQAASGALSTSPLHPGTDWPTSLAILAWRDDRRHAAARERAVDYLLAHAGDTFPSRPDGPIRVDSSIPGWAYVERTFSWVEPTAFALLALRSAGRGEHPRARDGIRLLLDRQMTSGGWNYGNPAAFGQELLPTPEATGVALAALAGAAPRSDVERSLARLADELVPALRTPYALAWGLLGLVAWNAPPADASAWLAETAASESRYGAYSTSERALLLVAAHALAGRSPWPTARSAR